MVLVHDTSLNVLYNCIKFHLNKFYGFQLTERTQSSIANNQKEISMDTICDGQTDPRTDKREINIQSRVMVLVHDTSSHCVLQLYEVSTK